MKKYEVGGSVRDSLLGIPNHDCDYVVTGATEEELLSLGYKKVGKSFPVFLDPETKAEVALARTEVKTGPRHQDFEFKFTPDITVEEDAQRRDLTINALYRDEEGHIIDPTGRGLRHIKEKVLRHVSDKFSEDPLRVLRVCRFAAQLKGFHIDPATMSKMQTLWPLLENLSQDRVDGEFMRALTSGYDSRAFLESMLLSNVLKLRYPEIYAYKDNKENTKFHSTGSTWGHVLNALDKAIDFSPQDKLAVILHDIYKPIAYKLVQEKLDADGVTKEGMTSAEFKENYYVAHDSDEAVEYVKQFFANHRFPLSYQNVAISAVKYHMRMWHLFDGASAAKWIDLIDEVTSGFNKDNFYKLESLLNVCYADDQSDKTEFCGHSLKDRNPTLRETAIKTFNVCSELHVRDLYNYQDKTWEQQKEGLRSLRIAKVRSEVPWFRDNLIEEFNN